MIVERTGIPEVRLVTPRRFVDGFGVFSETWSQNRLAGANVPGPFVQDNHATSVDRVAVRGLHIQIAPRVQRKLIRVVRGAIWDAAVDIRSGWHSFGRHVSVTLSTENWRRLRITTGFLHGYCTLAPDDPALAIQAEAILSYRDRALHRPVSCSNWIAA